MAANEHRMAFTQPGPAGFMTPGEFWDTVQHPFARTQVSDKSPECEDETSPGMLAAEQQLLLALGHQQAMSIIKSNN